jgi:type II secretory ATPase GspE/PulE/Tfp pilus assembly ATPase PilB-like protein
VSRPRPESTLALIPPGVSLDALREEGIVPLREESGLLVVAASDPGRLASAQVLAAAGGRGAILEIRPEEEIQALLRACYDAKGTAVEESASAVEGIDDLTDLTRMEVLSDSVDAPVIRLVNGLLLQALNERATDVHFEPYEEAFRVRTRVDGVLFDRYDLPKGHQAPVTSRIKVMARMDIAERFVPQDGRIGISLGDRAVDIRVNSLPTRYGERLALRLLDKTSGLVTLQDLGMADEERLGLERLIRHPYGMILLTGPTGSGKSTTLYGILQELRRPEVNILTVEDPVEYDLPGVAQVQVNEKAGLTFAGSLRAILRQDPDILMIGEMRDYETAHIGVQASLTGHLVLSTLHTNDSVSAVTRLADMGVEPYLVAGCLLGVVAQRLVRRLCPHCKEPVPVPSFLARMGLTEAWRGAGCPLCNGTGFHGRMGLYERFDVTPPVAEAIASRAPQARLFELAREAGLRTLLELGADRVRQGLTSPDEVLRVVGEGLAP